MLRCQIIHTYIIIVQVFIKNLLHLQHFIKINVSSEVKAYSMYLTLARLYYFKFI